MPLIVPVGASNTSSILNDVQFCVKLKIVGTNQTEFLSLEKARQQTLGESHPIEMIRQAYMNSEKSALVLINSMLSLIESYADMPPNSSLRGCYKEVCVKAIDPT